jgi:hypothetical protein
MELCSRNQVHTQGSASVTKSKCLVTSLHFNSLLVQEAVNNEPEAFCTKDRIDEQLNSNDVKKPRRMSIAVDQVSKRTRQKKAGQVEAVPEVVTLQ